MQSIVRWIHRGVMAALLLLAANPLQAGDSAALAPDVAQQIAEAYAMDGLDTHLTNLGRQTTSGLIRPILVTAIESALTERAKAGPLPSGAALARDPALQQAIRDSLRAQIKAALPQMVRQYYVEGLLGNAVGAETIAQAEQIIAGIADHASRTLNDNLDQLVEAGYSQLMTRMVPCWSGTGPSSAHSHCPIAGLNVADLRGSIDALVNASALDNVFSRQIGNALGQGTVSNIRERLTTALDGQLPAEALHYLKAGPDAFRKYAEQGRAFLPTAQLAGLKKMVLDTPLLTLPNGVYGGMLAASAAKHFAQVICGPFCINFFELKRGAEVVNVLQWQLRNREQITLSLAQLLDLGKALGNKFGLPPIGQWGKFGTAYQKVRGDIDRVQQQIAKLDAYYDKATQKILKPLDAAVADIQQQLEKVQHTLLDPMLDPLRDALPDIRDSMAEAANTLKDKLPDDFNGLPGAWADIKSKSGMRDGLLGKSGEQTPLDLLGIRVSPAATSWIPTLHPSRSSAFDPVLLHNGEFYHQAHDLTLPIRGRSLDFVRTYRSRLDSNGALGFNWTHNFAEQLSRNPARPDEALWWRADGTTVVFTRAADGWQSPRGVFSRLCTPADAALDPACTAAPWTVLHPDRSLTQFSADGRVQQLRTANGHAIVCTYDPNTQRLVQVGDQYGHALHLVYDARGRLIDLADWTDRHWRYAYDDVGDLIAVTSPGTDAYPDGLTTRYHYTRDAKYPALNHNLDAITDPKGQTYLRNSYGRRGIAFDHVVAQYYGDAPQPIIAHYQQLRPAWLSRGDQAVQQVDITDRMGHRQRYQHNRWGELIGETRWRAAAPIETRFAYDEEGRRVAAHVPDGTAWRYRYDDAAPDRRSQGNALEQTRVTNAGTRVWTTQYRPASSLPIDTTTPAGRTTHYSYDARDNLQTITLPSGASYHWVWRDGVVRAARDPLGVETTYEYNALLQPTRVRQRVGAQQRSIARDYDLRGNLVRETDALGYSTIYQLNARNQVIEERRANGLRTQLRYDANDNIADMAWEVTPGTFRHVQQRFNVLDQLIERTVGDDTLRRSVRWEYTPNGQMAAQIGPGATRLRWTWDSAEQLQAVQRGDDAAFETTRWTRDALGRPLRISAEVGETSIAYTPWGEVARWQRTGHPTTVAAYDVAGHLTQLETRDDAGELLQRWQFEYDAAGARTAVVQQVGAASDAPTRRWEQTFDTAGHLLTRRDPLGRVQQWRYDAFGHAVAYRDAVGRETTWRYNARGERIATIAPNGATTTVDFDAVGQLVQWRDPVGRARQLTYDGVGQLLAFSDAQGGETRWRYDALGRVIQSDTRVEAPGANPYNPDGMRSYQLTWNDSDQLAAFTDDLGRTTSYEYDSLQRLQRTMWADGASESRTWNRAGQLARWTTPDQRDWNFSYTPSGDIAHVRVNDADDAQLAERTYQYDPLGRPRRVSEQIGADPAIDAQWHYDAWGALLRETQPGAQIEYDYDAAGQLVRRRVNGDDEARQYDATGRVTAVETAGQRVTLTYADGLQPTEIRHADGSTIRTTFDAAQRPLVQRIAPAHGAAGTWTTEYDARGNVSRVARSDSMAWRYTYDSADQLRAAQRTAPGAPPHELRWLLDGVGNWRERHSDGRIERLEYSPRHAPLAQRSAWYAPRTVRHDAAGRLTDTADWRLTYDPFGRLQSIAPQTDAAPAWRFSYDALGRRLGDGHTQWIHSGWQEVAWTDAQHTTRAVPGDARDQTFAVLQSDIRRGVPGDVRSETIWSPIVQDPQGNVRATLGAAGATTFDADPYADAPSTAPLRAFGRPGDAAAPVVSLRHRDYFPALGRFTTPDPLGYKTPQQALQAVLASGSAYTAEPHMGPDRAAAGATLAVLPSGGALAQLGTESNLYQYARNNPLRYRDTEGLYITITTPDPALPTHLNVHITAEYNPTNLPENLPDLFQQAAAQYWTGEFPNVNDPANPWELQTSVDLQLRNGKRDYTRHYIAAKALRGDLAKATAYVNERGAELMVMNQQLFNADEDYEQRHTIAHEIGHWMGLKDRYDRKSGVSNAGYENNLMGCIQDIYGCRLGGNDKADIDELLDYYRRNKLNKYLDKPSGETMPRGPAAREPRDWLIRYKG